MTLRPLRELTTAADADEALAAKLARSVPVPRADAIPFARATARPSSLFAWAALRPALAVALLVLLVAAAGAAIGGLRHLEHGAPSLPPPSRETPRRASGAVAAPVVAPTATVPDNAPVPPRRVATRASVAAEPVPRDEAAPEAVVVPVDDPLPATHERPEPQASADFSLLVRALRVLREDHDPAAASAIVRHYLELHPQGALVEEAMAIRVEAAIAAHDPGAAAIARDYLSRYPAGRYASAAERASQAP